MDHELIHRTIISNGGKIVGGYVREWIANGEPSNTGWSDIDILVDPQHQETIKKQLIDIGIRADFQARLPFNDFYCNCWGYDGSIFPISKTEERFSVDQIMEQTKNKEAHAMKTNRFILHKWIKFQIKGWKLFDHHGNPLKQSMVDALLKKHQAILAWKKAKESRRIIESA
jgi:hypothetical protein